MSELEKKLSDFQISECKDLAEQATQPVDTKLCPTCTPDENFIVPVWYEEQDPFLDKSTCEYVARVYTSQLENTVRDLLTQGGLPKLQEEVMKYGVTEILEFFDKPLNNSVRNRVMQSAYISDEYQNTETSQLGIAYRVTVPAFNLDQIQPEDEDEDDESSSSQTFDKEIILKGDGLNRKLFQLKSALVTYQFYYASSRSVSKDFVIRQEEDQLAKINYADAIQKITVFKREINDLLSNNKLAKIGHIGAFRTPVLKFKFLFEEGEDYKLKQLWVLPKDKCDEYVKISVGKNNILRKEGMSIVYHFMKNLDKMINDITAKETKPWLEFTLDYFYPTYIVDYGGIEEISEVRDGLGCIIESQLGLEPGVIVDSLTDEIISAFTGIANEYAKEACRAIEQVSTKSPTGKKLEEDEVEGPSKEEQMINRYKKEYENKFYKAAISFYNDAIDQAYEDEVKLINQTYEGNEQRLQLNIELAQEIYSQTEKATKENIFKFIKTKSQFGGSEDGPAGYFYFEDPEYSVRDPDAQPEDVGGSFITDEETLKSAALGYAANRYATKESGNFRDKIGNSPHWADLQDAKEELVKKFETTYTDELSDLSKGLKEISGIDFIQSIGVCGVSKVAGKALKCLIGGIEIGDFTDIIIEKFFEFVNINSFSLFFNGLPANFKAEFSEAFENEFGSDVNLSELLGVVLEINESAKVSEITKSKGSAKKVAKLYEKVEYPRTFFTEDSPEIAMLAASFKMTTEEFLGPLGLSIDEDLRFYRDYVAQYNIQTKVYPDEKIVVDAISQKEMKRDKAFKNEIKSIIAKRKKESPDFNKAMKRFKSAMSEGVVAASNFVTDTTQNINENISERISAIKDDLQDTRDLKNYIEQLNQFIQDNKQEYQRLEDELRQSEISLLGLSMEISNLQNQGVDPNDYDLLRLINDASRLEGEVASIKEEMPAIQSSLASSLVERNRLEIELEEKTLGLDDVQKAIERLAAAAEQIENEVEDRREQQYQEFLSLLEETGQKITDFDAGEATKNAINSIKESASILGNSITQGIDNLILTTNEAKDDPSELSKIEKAANNFQETALGVKVDILFDVIFDFMVESIKNYFSIDELLAMIQKYPVADFIVNSVKNFFKESCPIEPIFVPAVKDFMKSLSLDVCDLQSFSLTRPQIIVPSINWKYQLEKNFADIFREAIIKVITDLLITYINKLMALIESSLCNVVEAIGSTVGSAIEEGGISGLKDSFLDALNEAFCNDGDDPEDALSKAEDLANALFSPIAGGNIGDPTGAGKKMSNIISSVSTRSEILEAMVNPGSQSNEQFTKRISNAVNILAPEANMMLGDQRSVEVFFKNLGSYLSIEDKNAIREAIDLGLPETPISSAICLTSDQLQDWNDLRESLLAVPAYRFVPGANDTLPGEGLPDSGSGAVGFPDGFRNPRDIVDDLNKKTRDAVEDLVDSIADLGSEDGPFFGAATNEALKDVCNPDNVFNDVSQPEFEKQIEEEEVDGFYGNLMRTLMWGFTFRGGLFAEALADREGRREFGRKLLKIFNPNYGNSMSEQVLKYNNKRLFGQLVMKGFNNFQDDPQENEDGVPMVLGDFPDTVAITQRKEILEDEEGRSYSITNLDQKVGYMYKEGSEDDPFMYKLTVKSDGLKGEGLYDYELRVVEEVFEDKTLVPSFLEEVNADVIVSENIQINLTEPETEYIEGIIGDLGSFNPTNIRRGAFNRIMKNKSGIDIDFRPMFGDLYEAFNKSLVEELLTNPLADDGLPIGYKFGYISDELTKESFEYYNKGTTTKYNLPESEKTLGEFKDPRIIALDPKIYGGKYSNPPFYVEKRQFFGWLEVATKAFESLEGCDPKSPPLFDFSDIRDRVKDLNSSIKNDPRLSKEPECVKEIPFNHLTDSKTKASLDGVVRTTLRSYLVEYFTKGYGLLSNLQLRQQNFDNSIGVYVVKKMKREMMEMGTSFSNSKIRIVRERYWYTFLEQVVECYNRMVQIDGVVPPENISNALEEIQLGMDAFRPITRESRKRLRKNMSEFGFYKPTSDYDPLEIVKDSFNFNLQSIAFRLTPHDELDDFFNGELFTDINKSDVRFASIKKLKFFQKIYFIALYEKQATMIMSEFINMEFQRVSSNLVDGINDKPYYYDLKRSLFSMQSIFNGSTSRIGTNPFYIEKQQGYYSPGTVNSVPLDNSVTPGGLSEDPRFILEKYVRLEEKQFYSVEVPVSFSERGESLKNVVSISDFESFVDDNLDDLENFNLSDLFGDLRFSYDLKLRDVFENGFTSAHQISRLKLLNEELIQEIDIALQEFESIKSPQRLKSTFISSSDAPPSPSPKEDVLETIVKVDQSFLPEGYNEEPSGTLGSLGVKMGLRVSVVLPTSFIDQATIQSNPDILQKSIEEKSFVYDDGGFAIPLVTSEVDIIDTSFDQLSLTSGENSYDLECLIEKMVESPEFTYIFEKIFDIKQVSSMLAIYCMETLPASIGRDETERNDVSDDPDVDAWDRTVNRFAKNFLRRQFKSHYLSRSMDGQSEDDDESPGFLRLFQFSNPFDFNISVKIPWWKLRRQKFKIYDANSLECADPKKDLQ